MLTVAQPEDSRSALLMDRRAILVAVRGPSVLNPSLEWAAQRARATDVPLTLVHAVPSADLMPPGTRYTDVVAAGRTLLQAEGVRLSARFPTLRVGTYLHCGDVVHALLGLSADASLLVVGADRLNAVTGVFQGSVAVEVALGSLAPVLIIPTAYRESGERNGTGHGHVVIGVDGSAESYAALTRAAAEAHRSGAALRVVAAMKPDSPVSEDLTVSTAALLLEIRTRYPSLVVSWVVDLLRTPVRALIRHSRDAGMLVIGRHGRGARSAMGLGSVTHTLLLRPPCPTLVLTLPQVTPPVPGQAALQSAPGPTPVAAGTLRLREGETIAVPPLGSRVQVSPTAQNLSGRRRTAPSPSPPPTRRKHTMSSINALWTTLDPAVRQWLLQNPGTMVLPRTYVNRVEAGAGPVLSLDEHGEHWLSQDEMLFLKTKRGEAPRGQDVHADSAGRTMS